MVVFVDEIEKAFAGTGTDLSGVKTEMTGTMLSWMQDREADGVVLIGPAGTAKSAIAKATGNTAGIPTIAFDFGAMQNSLVGASGERLRAALQVVDAVSSGRSLWIATCNSIGVLPPELRRRFTLGTFFFDCGIQGLCSGGRQSRAVRKISDSGVRIRNDDCHQKSFLGKFFHISCRASSISSALRSIFKSAQRPRPLFRGFRGCVASSRRCFT